jgi:hypothetical protein
MAVGLVVVAIGLSFGANAGYAINPARDFGPRLFAWIAGWEKVAMPGDYGSIGAYFWIPLVWPMIGGLIGALAYDVGIRDVLVARGERPDDVESAGAPWRTSRPKDGLGGRRSAGGPAAVAARRRPRARRWRGRMARAVRAALEGVPERVHRGRQVRELLEVLLAERLEPPRALVGEPQADRAEVVRVGRPAQQARGLGPVDEADRAVMAEEQVLRDVADGGAPRVVVAADGEQELVLGRRQPGRRRLPLAPAQEAPQPGAELEQRAVLGVGRLGCHRRDCRLARSAAVTRS